MTNAMLPRPVSAEYTPTAEALSVGGAAGVWVALRLTRVVGGVRPASSAAVSVEAWAGRSMTAKLEVSETPGIVGGSVGVTVEGLSVAGVESRVTEATVDDSDDGELEAAEAEESAEPAAGGWGGAAVVAEGVVGATEIVRSCHDSVNSVIL